MHEIFFALAIAVLATGPVVASEEKDVMAPVHKFVDGFNFKMKGKLEKETGSMFAFAPQKGPTVWHITGWAWTKH
jgi:hypothetical protein